MEVENEMEMEEEVDDEISFKVQPRVSPVKIPEVIYSPVCCISSMGLGALIYVNHVL